MQFNRIVEDLSQKVSGMIEDLEGNKGSKAGYLTVQGVALDAFIARYGMASFVNWFATAAGLSLACSFLLMGRHCLCVAMCAVSFGIVRCILWHRPPGTYLRPSRTRSARFRKKWWLVLSTFMISRTNCY